jgi:trk system potassium uptake protein TrkH
VQALARSLFPVVNVLGVVVLLFGGTMLVPLAFAFFGHDAALPAYDNAIVITLVAGGLMVFGTYRFKRELLPRDGFLLVTLVWTVLPAFATLPLLFFVKGLSFTDAYFETMSGLTTTGGTVLSGLDKLPLSINVWRHLLVWLGGMGILVLVVAILPMLGVGGSQAFKAESTGVMKEAKLTPRIAETAKGLYAIYFAISAACFLAYRIAGMTWADAMMHMFSTMGLGGFSSHDANFGYFESQAIETVSIAFMLIAGFNFSIHFLAWRRRSLRVYWHDPEGTRFLLLMLASVVAVATYLLWQQVYPDFATAWRHAAFNVVAIATTTGYSSVDYNQWPTFAPALMLFLCMFATCAGSTGGGIKMIRAIILLKQAKREFVRILHPHVINPVKIGGQIIENNVIFAVLAFMLIYGASVIGCTLLLLASGLDVVTAFTAVIACINNTGPGLNQVGPATTYAVLSDFETWVCTFAMLIGRLELLSVLVLFTPAFWRK